MCTQLHGRYHPSGNVRSHKCSVIVRSTRQQQASVLAGVYMYQRVQIRWILLQAEWRNWHCPGLKVHHVCMYVCVYVYSTYACIYICMYACIGYNVVTSLFFFTSYKHSRTQTHAHTHGDIPCRFTCTHKRVNISPVCPSHTRSPSFPTCRGRNTHTHTHTQTIICMLFDM